MQSGTLEESVQLQNVPNIWLSDAININSWAMEAVIKVSGVVDILKV